MVKSKSVITKCPMDVTINILSVIWKISQKSKDTRL
jgi:hypothetical protein